MSYSIIWIVSFFISIPQYVLALKATFNPRLSINKFAYIIISACFCVFCFLIQDDFYVIPIFNIALILITCFSLKATAKTRALYGIFIFFLINSLAYFFRLPYAIIFSASDNVFNDATITICKLITGIIFFSLILLIKKRRKHSDKPDFFNTPLVISVGICAIITLFCIALIEVSIPYVSAVYSAYSYVAAFIVALSYLAITIFVMFVIKIRQDNYNQKLKAQQERIFFEEQNFYMQKLLEKEEDTRKFRHDFNGYLLSFLSMAKGNDNETLIESINNLLVETHDISSKIYNVGNDIISSALTYCFSELNDARISVIGKITHKLDIKPMDLSIIFYNIFNNVVEAINNCTTISRYATVIIENTEIQNKAFTHIQVKNSTENEIKLDKNALPITIKADIKNHGFGIRQIKDLIERNDGSLSFSSNLNEFSIDIFIKAV